MFGPSVSSVLLLGTSVATTGTTRLYKVESIKKLVSPLFDVSEGSVTGRLLTIIGASDQDVGGL